jgi:phosphopantothenoylcysteine decarboxylase/phosphopantothenate--cysteine ligase
MMNDELKAGLDQFGRGSKSNHSSFIIHHSSFMKIVLGVTGCIGAYKAAFLLRLLQEAGAEVRVVMTESAQRFVGPVTFEALSGHPVVTTMWPDPATAAGDIRHITLARWGDLLVVAPATANCLAKFANGICDDFLSTLYVSTTTPVLVAPAMNVEMWRHPATRENLERLRVRGVHVIDPGSGYLACGEVGEGRLAEPEEIAARALAVVRGQWSVARGPLPVAPDPGPEIQTTAHGSQATDDGQRTTGHGPRATGHGPRTADLAGASVLVTAGPTREPIDPVRFVTNRSSGRMGYAIAEAARDRGAAVTLVTGPVAIEPPDGVEVVRVETAAEMARETLARAAGASIVVKAAAVADYRPVHVADRKMKKEPGGGGLTLEFERTEDILAALGRAKGGYVLVGFAAETDDLVENARKKLEAKNVDLVVANDVTREGAGFDASTNAATLLFRDGRLVDLDTMTKREMADRILDEAIGLKKC